MRSYPPCPSCGLPAAPRLSGRGSVVERHEPDGPLCRAGTWRREVEERGLVRVTGELITDLSARVEVVYGPFVLTRADVAAETSAGGWGKAQRKPGVVTAAWAPAWAVVVATAFGGWWSEEKLRAFERARRDPEWREALLAVAQLSATADDGDLAWSEKVKADVRRAVVAFCAQEK